MISKEEIDLFAISTIKDCALEVFNRSNLLQYESVCQQIDRCDLPEQDKEILKNTNYVLLLIKIQMLQNADHSCSIEINSNGTFLCDTKIGETFDSNLLCQLCVENEIDVATSQKAGSIELHFYIDEKKRTRK